MPGLTTQIAFEDYVSLTVLDEDYLQAISTNATNGGVTVARNTPTFVAVQAQSKVDPAISDVVSVSGWYR